MAAVVAMVLGVCPKFGAVIQSIPNPVLGGVSLILYGLIALMGVKIWLDAKVDFSNHRNLVVAGASIIVATGLGVKGVTIGGLNLAGIAVGTLLALVLNLLLSLHRAHGAGEHQRHPREREASCRGSDCSPPVG
jgi:putative pyrimidine permease RutG